MLVAIAVLAAASNSHADALYHVLRALATSGGRERTLDEYRVLLEGTGFALREARSTRTPWSLIIGSPE